MQHRLFTGLLLLWSLILSWAWRESTALGAPPSDAPPEFLLRAGEIRLDGKIRSINAAKNSFVLDATSFTLPTGKTNQLARAKPKTILLTGQAVLHVRGDTSRKVTLADLKPGAFAIVAGKDTGSGKGLSAREIAVWDRIEAGEFSFGSQSVAPQPDAPPVPDAARPELVVQLGHTSSVTSMVFSPDAKILVSSSDDGIVKVWDVSTSELLCTLHGQGRSYFMADGRTLVTFDSQGGMTLWNTRTGKSMPPSKLQEALNQQLQNGAGASTFSPDGKIMAVAIQSQVKIFDVAIAQQIKEINTGNPQISILFAADGQTLASESFYDDSIKLWDVRTGVLKRTLPYKRRTGGAIDVNGGGAMAFSPDGKIFAAGTHESKVTLWSGETGAVVRTLNLENPIIRSIAFSPDGKTLAVCTGSSTLKLWDVKTGAVKQTLQQPAVGGMLVAAFAPRAVAGTAHLLACGAPYHITLWDAESGEWQETLRGRITNNHTVLFRPGSKLLVSVGTGIGAKFWNAQTGELTWTLAGFYADRMALSDDGNLLATALYSQITLWDVPKLKPLQTLESHTGPTEGVAFGINSLAFSPDGKVLASSSQDKLVKLWDARTGELKQVLAGRTYLGPTVAFSPDGKTLASGSIENKIRLWDVASGALTRTANEGALAVTFSPDGKTLAGAVLNGPIKLWNAATGELAKTIIPSKQGNITMLVFSPDGKLLASNSNNGSASIWDVETGQLRQTLTVDEGIKSVAFSSDGTTVICGTSDGSIKVWGLGAGPVLTTLVVLADNYRDERIVADWIAYTPEGYYQGSPDVAQFIRWRVGEKLYPAAKFEKQFHRPDIVQKALTGEK